jgi:hypothetical protein
MVQSSQQGGPGMREASNAAMTFTKPSRMGFFLFPGDIIYMNGAKNPGMTERGLDKLVSSGFDPAFILIGT